VLPGGQSRWACPARQQQQQHLRLPSPRHCLHSTAQRSAARHGTAGVQNASRRSGWPSIDRRSESRPRAAQQHTASRQLMHVRSRVQPRGQHSHSTLSTVWCS
jgi:hypothetical protein